VQDFGLALIAAGRGPARLPTCECTLRHAQIKTYVHHELQPVNGASAIVVRALSLFGPGELRALRVGDVSVFRLLASMLQPRCDGDGAVASQMARALDSLCAVELAAPSNDAADDSHAAAIIERCAATITELTGRQLSRLDRSRHLFVLARCTRLEVLTCPRGHALEAVCLGLSQLHTLHDVDLKYVSIAAIAAALPRLHTLTTYGQSFGLDKVAGFFTDLLPRLRVFHFYGRWPVEAATFPVAPLPLLEELAWAERGWGVPLPIAFLGARPIVLRAPYELTAESLPTRGGAWGETASRFLSRVCELRLDTYSTVSVDDVAQVLRAAPQLRTLHCDFHPRGDNRWLTAPVRPLHPAFVGFVHPRLRSLHVHTRVLARTSAACVSRLRRTSFPRLQELKFVDATFYVPPDASATGRRQVPDRDQYKRSAAHHREKLSPAVYQGRRSAKSAPDTAPSVIVGVQLLYFCLLFLLLIYLLFVFPSINL
jgi:hypothetical protein